MGAVVEMCPVDPCAPQVSGVPRSYPGGLLPGAHQGQAREVQLMGSSFC